MAATLTMIFVCFLQFPKACGVRVNRSYLPFSRVLS